MKTMNQRLKDAVSSVRQYSEPVEVYWGNGSGSECATHPVWNEPHDQRNNFWSGDLASMSTLRAWLKTHQPDNRVLTIYCRGDFRNVIFNQPLKGALP